MTSRHALVVGSQCDALRNLPLSFLPDRAQRLHAALTDRRLGECDPDPTISPLVLDPTVAELEDAVEDAVARAAKAKATLVFAFIGHAVTRGNRGSKPLYLLPKNGDATAPRSKTAYQLGYRLGDMDLGSLGGLILILDTCYAGAGAQDVIVSSLDLADRVRLELLAGTYHREARNGCFSKTLIELMELGRPDLSVDYLDAGHALEAAKNACQKVQDPPFHIGYGDQALWLSRNIASPAQWPLSGTAEGALAVTLTQCFQPTHDLERVEYALNDQRLVVIQGGVGSGKSTLVAALARPELVDLPRRYLSAVAFTELTPTLADIATSLATQLAVTTGFSEAAATYSNGFTPADLEGQPTLERQVFGPLRHLKVPVAKRLRLAIDGIDQLKQDARHDLMATILEASQDESLQRVSILLSTQDPCVEELGMEPIRLTHPAGDEIIEYLERRKLPVSLTPDLSAQAATWLQLRILADIATARGEQSIGEAAGLDDLYPQLLASLAPQDNKDARIVLRVLTAADSGPIMPIRDAVQATSQLGGPADAASYLNVLADLDSVVTRLDPGTPDERTGILHTTLSQHIREWDGWVVSSEDADQVVKNILKRRHETVERVLKNIR